MHCLSHYYGIVSVIHALSAGRSPTGVAEGLYTLARNSLVDLGDDVIVFFAFNGSLVNGLGQIYCIQPHQPCH